MLMTSAAAAMVGFGMRMLRVGAVVERFFVQEKLGLRILTTIPTWKIWELSSCWMAPRWLLVGSSVRGKFSIVRRYVVCKFELERELSGWRYEEGAVERTACSVAWPLLSDIFYLHRVHEFAKGQAVSGFLCHVC